MGRRGVQVSAEELFDYTPAHSSSALSASTPTPPQPRHASSKRPHHFAASAPVRTREQFVAANYSFAVSPDCAAQLEDPDALDWRGVDVVFTPAAPPDCPICLCPPRAPRITRCGHILDHVCALQLLHHAAVDAAAAGGGKQPAGRVTARCPLCADELDAADLRSVAFLGRQALKPGHVLPMRLVARPKYSVVARPYCESDRVADFAAFPRKVTSREPFFSRLVSADPDYLLDLVAGAVADLEAVLKEDPSLRPFVIAAKAVSKEQREVFRLRRRLLRLEEAAAATAASSSSTPLPDVPMSPASTSASVSSVESGGGAQSVALPSASSSLKSFAPVRNSSSSSPDGGGSAAPRWPPAEASAHQSPGMYVFFQAADGSHVYLHPSCHRIVAAEFAGRYSCCPPLLERAILQLDQLTMDEALRKRYRFLGHLPLGCEFSFVELDMAGVVSPETLLPFASEIAEREQARKRKAMASERENRRIAKQETKSLRTYFQLSEERLRSFREERTVDSTDVVSFPPISFAAAPGTMPVLPVSEDPGGSSSAAVSSSATSGADGPPTGIEAPSWGAAVSSYSAATSNMGVFPALSAVVSAEGTGSKDGPGGMRSTAEGPEGSTTTRALMTPPRLGTIAPGSRPVGPSSSASVSPPRGVWAESPPRGAWASSPTRGSPPNASTNGPSPPRGVPPYPRRGGRKQQITLLSNAGPQQHRR